MTLICGIDEAGRGPVIGPMVMSGILIEESDIPKLKSLGVKDSKLLTKKQRNLLFKKIIKTVKAHKIIIIPPKEIDDALESDHLNLNWLEAHKTAEIINKLKPDKVIVDSPSNNCEAYTKSLKKLLHNPKSLQLICIHKADVKHPEIFRQTWVSYKNHKQAKFQKTLEDFKKFVKKQN